MKPLRRPMLRRISLQTPTHDEAGIKFGEGTIASVPIFQGTGFSNRFTYTRERAELNILLSVLSSLGLTPTAIEKQRFVDYRIILTDSVIDVELKTIVSSDEEMANTIHDMGAGLLEWLYSRQNSAPLNELQVTFVVPSLQNIPPIEVFEELKAATVSREITEAERDSLSDISPRFTLLSKLGAKWLIRSGTPPFVQVTRGALSVEGPARAVQRLLFTTRSAQDQLDRQPAKLGKPVWLIVWYQAVYSSFTVEASRSVLEAYDPSPFARIIVGDGRHLAIVDRNAGTERTSPSA